MVSTYPIQRGSFANANDLAREVRGNPSITVHDITMDGAGIYFRRGPTRFRPPANKGRNPPKPANEANRNWWRELGKALAVGTAAVTHPHFWQKGDPGGDIDPSLVGPGWTLAVDQPHVVLNNAWMCQAYDAGVWKWSTNLGVGTHYVNVPTAPNPTTAFSITYCEYDPFPAGANEWYVRARFNRATNPSQALPGTPPLTSPTPNIISVEPVPWTWAFPSADPFWLPITTPVPTPRAVPFALARGALRLGVTSPLGDPQLNGEPSLAPTPVVFPAPGTAIVWAPGSAAGLQIQGNARREPPRKRERERKTNPVAVWVYAGLGFVTETLDALEAVWKALPGKYKTRIKGQRTTPQQMAEDLYRNWDKVDVPEAIENLVWEAIEDRIYGAMGKQTKQANQRDQRIPGWSAGPAI